jgi:hypothetical protein
MGARSRIGHVVGIDDRLAALEQRLGEVVGDASLCTASRAAGGPVPGVKYVEGGVAALREARRAVRDGEGEPAALDAALASWRAELARAREREMGGDWLAYRAGGVDALEDAAGAARGAP